MTVKEYAEIFSDMFHCTECYRCKSDSILCHNYSRPKTEINIEPWKDYPNIYCKLKCMYKSFRACDKCIFNDQGICMGGYSESSLRLFDQEIEQFMRNTTGEVEIYE